jgi:hypothetical protein
VHNDDSPARSAASDPFAERLAADLRAAADTVGKTVPHHLAHAIGTLFLTFGQEIIDAADWNMWLEPDHGHEEPA